jgi:putative transposase
LHDLNSAYANWLRCKRKLVGHVFQGRFKSILVDTETYAISLSIYIHLNPCRWGLVKQPENYAWSSCRDYLGQRDLGTPALDTSRILAAFGRDPESARAGYLALLRERRDMDDPLKQAFRRIALGSPSFVDRIRHLINAQAVERNIRELPVRAIRQCRALSPAQVFDTISAVTGCSVPEILGKRRGRPWRAMGMYMVKRHCAIGLRQAGEIWGVDYTSISRAAKEFSVRLEGDAELGRQLAKAEALLEALRQQGPPPLRPEEKANTQGPRLAF